MDITASEHRHLLNSKKYAPTTRGTLAKTAILFKARYNKLKRVQNVF